MFEALGIDSVRDAMLEWGFAKVEAKLRLNMQELIKGTPNKYHALLLQYVTDLQPNTETAQLESFFSLKRVEDGFAIAGKKTGSLWRRIFLPPCVHARARELNGQGLTRAYLPQR